MVTHNPRIADGLLHRVISSLVGVLALPLYLYEYGQRQSFIDLFPVLACIGGIALGFAAPVILTKGFNKPIPSSRHLALVSPRVQRWLGFITIWFLGLPSLIRMGSRLLAP